MMDEQQKRILLIDTCGDGAGVALAQGQQVVGAAELPSRMASAEIVGAIRGLLHRTGWALSDLDGVGVVSGPGSFTGVRTGLAAAKGICEGSGLPLVAVSRLEVLQRVANLKLSFVALYAGRDEVYVREQETGREWLESIDRMINDKEPGTWVVAEERVADMLRSLDPTIVPLTVADTLPLVHEAFLDGAIDAALVDGNYVRAENEIYKKAGALAR